MLTKQTIDLFVQRCLVGLIFVPISLSSFLHNEIDTKHVEAQTEIQTNHTSEDILSDDILLSEKLKMRASELIGTYGGSCVQFIQQFVGLLDDCQNNDCYNLPFKGWANDVKPNSSEPKIGSIILLNDGEYGHVALLIDIIDGDYLILESNFGGKGMIQLRTIEMNNPHNVLQKNKIRGFYDYTISSDEFSATVTGYSSTPDQTDDTPFITASGKRVGNGIIACPRKYPFGTKFDIDGKEYTCEDRLNIKYDDRFDVWFETREEAVAFGSTQRTIKVID